MKYREIKGNLFDMSKEYSLAHCISLDCALGAGIAKEFQNRYPNMVNKLRAHISQNRIKTIPIVLSYKIGPNRYIFNLVTKEKYWQKPTYDTLGPTLVQMKNYCIYNNINKIAMPLIGCGLDRLKWNRVSQMIKDIFNDTDIEIVVCKL